VLFGCRTQPDIERVRNFTSYRILRYWSGAAAYLLQVAGSLTRDFMDDRMKPLKRLLDNRWSRDAVGYDCLDKDPKEMQGICDITLNVMPRGRRRRSCKIDVPEFSKGEKKTEGAAREEYGMNEIESMQGPAAKSAKEKARAAARPAARGVPRTAGIRMKRQWGRSSNCRRAGDAGEKALRSRRGAQEQA